MNTIEVTTVTKSEASQRCTRSSPKSTPLTMMKKAAVMIMMLMTM